MYQLIFFYFDGTDNLQKSTSAIFQRHFEKPQNGQSIRNASKLNY